MLIASRDPMFAAPFVSSVMRVDPGWIDYNGHLNMAYYNVLFDRAVDEVFELLGCGVDYVKTRKHSCYTAEVHVRYLRELHAGDAVKVTWQLIDYDAKRQRLRIDYGNGASTSYEYDPQTFLLIGMLTRRTAGLYPGDDPQPPPAGRD